jgi:DNA-binding transcriptional MerR regulator
MKVSELSRRAQVPLPTIKFYIREGLLPAGARTDRNQAEYSEEHLERLSLIRALRDDAGLSVAAIGRALSAADAASEEDFVVAAIDAIERPSGPTVDEKSKEFRTAQDALMELAHANGWALEEKSLAVRDAARALTVITRSFFPDAAQILAPYAEAVSILARLEIPEGWRPAEAPNAALRYAVLGTVLLEPFILALRRMAHVARANEMMKKYGTVAPQTQGNKTVTSQKRRKKTKAS